MNRISRKPLFYYTREECCFEEERLVFTCIMSVSRLYNFGNPMPFGVLRFEGFDTLSDGASSLIIFPKKDLRVGRKVIKDSSPVIFYFDNDQQKVDLEYRY